MPAKLSGDKESLATVRRLDDEVDILYAQIPEYKGELSRGALAEGQTQEFLNLMEALTDLENIGDTIEKQKRIYSVTMRRTKTVMRPDERIELRSTAEAGTS